ncbi:hypothetical protein IMSHALPRED_001329 [Imshaugia aleurites]|uniref:Uncharacterized protein n=1 Tax=Imshaugia aleurites TaxID=172621 RepID=A0A8H3J2I0_9LECA|nr:hypothetical protein IMSHALPRED_001329 [Imshaugia aleurites]
MILLSPVQCLQIAFYLIHTLSVAGEASKDHCDHAIYGIPKYSACVNLLYGHRHKTGIFNIDDDQHGFFLPYFGDKAQFTVDQWRHRVTLPEVWQNHACKIALLVKESPTGGFTTDSGSWADIANRGRALIDDCLLTRRVANRGGGVGSAGTHGRLSIVVYEWGSGFDHAINRGVKPGGPVAVGWNETMLDSRAGGRSGNMSYA